MLFTTTDPKGGRAANVGTTVLYVTGGEATQYYKYGAGDTEWCVFDGASPSGAEPTTAFFGLARRIGCVSAAAAGSSAEFRHNQLSYCLGDVAGGGGFTLVTRFAASLPAPDPADHGVDQLLAALDAVAALVPAEPAAGGDRPAGDGGGLPGGAGTGGGPDEVIGPATVPES